MKNIVFLLLILLSGHIFYGQTTQHFEFAGLIKLKESDKTGYTYKIEFTLNGRDIKGFSITGAGTKNEIKSNIIGYMEGEKIYFEEIDVVYAPEGANSFCYFAIDGTVDMTGTVVHGSFISYLNRNKDDVCERGFTELTTTKKLPVEETKIEIKTDTTKKKIEYEAKYFEVRTNIVLKDEQSIDYYTQDKTIRLAVYDKDDVDGDRITLIFNDQEILKNFKLDEKPHEITLNLNEGSNTLEIFADNEGVIPPNTTGIKLIDSVREQLLKVDLNEEEQAYINIIKLE